jgi:eukaryotic-like serine/threonine-protein kinase
MEYVEGANLKLLITRSDPVLAENVAQIVIDMALGLEQVHDSGFIHLDFKPENILVSPTPKCGLIDFDLAQPKPEEPKKMAGNPGTPAYMAPEHLQHLALDQRADIFAFGVTAYEVLTFAKPFPGDTPDEILRKQLNDELIAPARIERRHPRCAMEKIILKCLECDLEERYPYMSVVVRDLQAALYV